MKINLYNNDCLEQMKKIEDESVDFILCDLPYGTTACKWDVVIPFNKYVQIGKKVIYEQEYVFDKMKSGVSYKEALEDFLSISKDGLWDNYKRIIKDRGAIVLFGSEPFSSYLRMSNIKNYRHEWYWNKNNSAGFVTAKIRPFSIIENILVFSNNKANYYPQMETRGKPRNKGGYSKSDNYNIIPSKSKSNEYYPKNLINISNASQKGKVHPTQKPVALLE